MKDLLKTGQILGRSEMKKIMAGSGGNVCRIYSGGSWGGCSWSVSEAQSWYNNHSGVTGYCCASCASMCY